jgi:hypothetical protein
MKGGLQGMWEKRAEKPWHGALGLANKFLENSRLEEQQGKKLEALWAVVSRMLDLPQLVEGFEMESCKAEFQEISKEFQKEEPRHRKWLNHS